MDRLNRRLLQEKKKENVEEETIIAQYPVLIGITTHLDEVEKEYLSNIIKPFRDRVENVEKCDSGIEHGEYITIRIRDDVPIELPIFEKNTLYQNMETYIEYTLEELGL